MEEISNRKNHSEKFQKVVNHITDFLRRKFAFVDFENLSLLGKDADREAYRILDEMIFSVFERDANLIRRENSIDVEAYSLSRCIGWEMGGGGINFKNGILKFFSGFFRRREPVALPLYSVRK